MKPVSKRANGEDVTRILQKLGVKKRRLKEGKSVKFDWTLN